MHGGKNLVESTRLNGSLWDKFANSFEKDTDEVCQRQSQVTAGVVTWSFKRRNLWIKIGVSLMESRFVDIYKITLGTKFYAFQKNLVIQLVTQPEMGFF